MDWEAKIAELEQIARLHTAQAFAMERLVMAVMLAAPVEKDRLLAAFRLLSADLQDSLAESGFSTGVSALALEPLRLEIQQALSRLEDMIQR